MENESKEEIKVIAPNGADTKDKEKSKEETEKLEEALKNAKEKGIDVKKYEEFARKNIKEQINDEEEEIRKHWKKAYIMLDDEIGEKISQDMLNEIIKSDIEGKQIQVDIPEIKDLVEMHNKILQEEEDELFKNFNKELGGSLTENKNFWKEFKRAVLVGMFFGIPGAIFIGIKDSIDETRVKAQLKNAIKSYVTTGEEMTFTRAKFMANKTLGGIVDIDKLCSNLICSEGVLALKNNNNELSKITVEYIEKKEELRKELDNLVNEAEEEIIEEEEEENPEPVEGFKIGM